MKNIVVKINKRNLNSLVRKNNFNNGGMFISYQFIAIDFKEDKSNTAKFYTSTQVSQNSWHNYPGIKIWDNKNEAKYKKAYVIAECEDYLLNDLLNELEYEFPNITFQFVNFD